jgi:thioredoxin-dependent peroxiredoxin
MAAKKKTTKSTPAKSPAAKSAAGKSPATKSTAGKGVAAKTSASKAAAAKSTAKAKPAAKPAAKLPAKPAAKPPASSQASAKTAPKPKAEKPSLVKAVKQAAAKVAQVAAAAAVKVLDSDAGRKAPSFELADEKGAQVSSSTLAGKPYLLYFYPKDDTPGCTKEACDIRDNFARFGKQGLRVLGVSPDTQQSHAKFGKKYGLPFTLLSDPDKTLANAYGVWGEKNNYGKKYMGIVRSSFLVGADGVIKKSYRGVKVNGHVDAVLEDAKALL